MYTHDNRDPVDPPPIQVLTRDTGAATPGLGTARDDQRRHSMANIPGVWWMVTAVLVAVTAVAAQGRSIFGLMEANRILAKAEGLRDEVNRLSGQINELLLRRGELEGEIGTADAEPRIYSVNVARSAEPR